MMIDIYLLPGLAYGGLFLPEWCRLCGRRGKSFIRQMRAKESQMSNTGPSGGVQAGQVTGWPGCLAGGGQNTFRGHGFYEERQGKHR